MEAIEKQTAGKWHIIILQEEVEYLEQEFLTNRFHMTHFGGCTILFNNETFLSGVGVTSIYHHDLRGCKQDDVTEGESGWVFQRAISMASFRRQPLGGQKSFTVMSLHITVNDASKRGIGKKLLLIFRAVMFEELVDLVAGDFNKTAWRRSYGHGRPSVIEEAFDDTDLPMPPGLTVVVPRCSTW